MPLFCIISRTMVSTLLLYKWNTFILFYNWSMLKVSLSSRVGRLYRLLSSMVARTGSAGSLLLAQHRNALRGIQNEPRLPKQYQIFMTDGVWRPFRYKMKLSSVGNGIWNFNFNVNRVTRKSIVLISLLSYARILLLLFAWLALASHCIMSELKFQHLVLSWNVLALWNSMFGRQETTTSYHFMPPRAKQLAQWRIHYGHTSDSKWTSSAGCKISEIYLKQR